MQFVIRTIEGGQRLPLETVDAKRRAVKDKILAAGLQYLEMEAMLGSYNAMMERIEERVYLIQGIVERLYV